MKIILLLFCTTAFSLTPVKSFSQNEITINSDKKVSVDEVFEIIKTETSYRFIYRSDMFEDFPLIHLKKGTYNVEEFLKYIFRGQGVNFKIKPNKSIVIDKEKQTKTPPQDRTISGMVSNEEDMPMQGVTVMVKDTIQNTITNWKITGADGQYEIIIEGIKNKVLVFTMMGYESQTFFISDKSTIDVKMQLNIGQLDAVEIISSGYQKISEERSTGAYETIKKEVLKKPSSSVAESLVGHVAGLQSTINADGSIDLEIRGQTSLYADANPLIVVDGFPTEGGFRAINPNNVESITVLKDAAATSIWGAKSANGVIVITTKDGNPKETEIAFSTFVRASPKIDLDYALGLASSEEALDYAQNAFNTKAFGANISLPGATINDMTSAKSLAFIAMNEARLGRITFTERDNILNRLRGLNNQAQIKDYLLQVPIINQYNLSISGGSETMQNRLSLLFESNKGKFKGDKREKYLINYKNKINIAKGLDFNFSGMLLYSEEQNNGVDLSFISSLAPWDMLKDEHENLTNMLYLEYYMPNFNEFVPKEEFPYPDWSYNPITEIANRDLTTKRLNADIQAGLTWEIMEGLDISSAIKYEKYKTSVRNYYNENTFKVRKFVNIGSSWGYSGPVTQNIPKGGVLESTEYTINAYYIRNQLNFNRTFAKKHEISFLAGTEISSRVRKVRENPNVYGFNEQTLGVSELSIPPDATTWTGGRFYSFLNGFRLTPTSNFLESTDRFFSLYGNLAYTFDEKYILSGSARTDASNLITDDPKYRYNPFWSIGAGWNAHDEDFMKDISWLDRLKVRATFGYNGNIDKSTSFMPLIDLRSDVDKYTKEHTAGISSHGNPTLRWEKTETLNFGVDFSLWGRKLTGSIDIYRKKGSSLIIRQSLPAVYGTTSQKINSGKMINKGFELSIGTLLPIKGNDIIWSGNLNYAYNHSRITEFFRDKYHYRELAAGGSSAYMVGHDPNTLWSFEYAGMMNVGSEIHPVMKPSIYGLNGEKIPLTQGSSEDAAKFMLAEGTLNAPHNLGMYNNFKIYDFSLSILLTAKLGHVFQRRGFNYPTSRSSGNLGINEHYSDVLNADPEKIVPIPVDEERYWQYFRFTRSMDYLTADASHIRIQEINLSYSVPSKIIDKIGFKQAEIFAQANNIGTILFNPYGEDPEYPRGGLKLQRSFTLGLNLNF